MSWLANKVIWVTGASSGIGAEMAKQCAELGAKIVLSARNETKLKAVKESLPRPDDHLVLPLDLEDNADFSPKVKAVLDHYGKIDVLMNNGGLSQRSEAHETPLEVDRRLMEINYFGNIAMTKAVLPVFQQQKHGKIIVISSIAGKFGFFLRSAYAASKHALQGFYEALRLEEEKNNIDVLLVFPGKINTEISKHALNKDGGAHGVMDHNQATGMPVEECIEKLLKAFKQNKKEVLIGNKEIMAVTVKRFFPKLFYKIIKKQSAT
ncbi:Short-chain dehydrogenase [Lishizhenia tianjinensis]|uniref:Short-chain dehydrogenase n=1 Tax=Lishizhenia tianjinensis TaxID=477690 RepID=A0A1I7BKP0_9FLAO|nr:SDR family oxidoreductase [Lishizhenia tianjinensis]SFT87753.1 Short-chain dehydrogenase [Lishizhenia tianjinensis]